MGTSASQIGKLDEAVNAFQNAISIKPDDHEVIKDLGTAYQSLGEFNIAKDYYLKALSFNNFLRLSISSSILSSSEFSFAIS